MSCLREVQTISKSLDILPMPSLTRLTTGEVLNPLKNTTNTSHNELLHQDPLQPPLEPRLRGVAPKMQTTSPKNGEKGLFWVKWSAFWATRRVKTARVHVGGNVEVLANQQRAERSHVNPCACALTPRYALKPLDVCVGGAVRTRKTKKPRSKEAKKATKKRDTFVVSRWRGWGACRSRAPHRLRRECERSREERGKRSGRSER